MKRDKFKVFDSEELGRIFLPDGLSYDKSRAVHVSPLHGRAVAVAVADYQWISVKGGGWNYGGPQVYISNKDEELILGLYPSDSAARELAVSREIEKFTDRLPKVLYYKKLCDAALPEKYARISEAKFKNGVLVHPCLLYTQVKSPFRVADLTYFTESEKADAVEYCCGYWGIPADEYTKTFTEQLATHVALLHKHGFINDTLDYGNVTMLAEVIDYEWVTAPGIKLFDGTYGLQITDERKEKEILYGAEVCLQLKAMLHEEYNLFDIYQAFTSAYRKVNADFLDANTNIRKILNKEEIIL
ncbi:MAG: hypothetical protein J1G38_02085 [Clostridiales bacterium]|nr:hypothetical protein [Clostridiales bacterium]